MLPVRHNEFRVDVLYFDKGAFAVDAIPRRFDRLQRTSPELIAQVFGVFRQRKRSD